MAEKYQVRKFEPVNNSSYQFFEVSVNGKFQFQEFVNNLKDEVTTQSSLCLISSPLVKSRRLVLLQLRNCKIANRLVQQVRYSQPNRFLV